MKNYFFIAVCLLSVSLMSGCGDGGPRLVPAEGTVMLGANPLTGASVVVHYPDQSTATGRTDDKGVFSLVYSNGKPGAAPGNGLKVSITKTDEQGMAGGANLDPSDMMKKQQTSVNKTADGRVAPTAHKNLVPPKYADPNTSGITVDIPPEGKKDLKIELSS